MYNLNDIFYDNKDYSVRAKWCNENGFVIKEIEPDEKGRRFQIQNAPKPTKEKVLKSLRVRREIECFSYINRGILWYNTLTAEQQQELKTWYQAWLDVTDKYIYGIDINTIIPVKPSWLK